MVKKARITVSRPTKLVSFCIQVHGRERLIDLLIVKKYSLDELKGVPNLLSQQEIPFVCLEEELHEASFIDLYPKMNVFYEFQWKLEVAPRITKSVSEEMVPFFIE